MTLEEQIQKLTSERDAATNEAAQHRQTIGGMIIELDDAKSERDAALKALAYLEGEIDATLAGCGNDAILVREENGPETIAASVALTVAKYTHRIKELHKDLDAANAACAEMRDAIGLGLPMLADALQNLNGYKDWAARIRRISKSAHSISCGKGYVKTESLRCFKCDDGHTPLYCLNCAREGYHKDDEWKVVVEALKWCVDHCGGYDRQQAKEALAHAEKLTSQ